MDVDVNEGNIVSGRAGEPRRSSVLKKKTSPILGGPPI